MKRVINQPFRAGVAEYFREVAHFQQDWLVKLGAIGAEFVKFRSNVITRNRFWFDDLNANGSNWVGTDSSRRSFRENDLDLSIN